MPQVTNARVMANNDVAVLGWDLDVRFLPGLLGFHVVRQYLDADGAVSGERPLASYVAFTGQSNPGWLPQNTSVWPIQKFTWRDLTLRQRRDALVRRLGETPLRYSIAAVGALTDDRKPVDVVETPGSTYEGTPLPLGYLTEPAFTNVITPSRSCPPYTATFTRGVLSTQFLLHLLGKPDKNGALKFPPGLIKAKLTTTGDGLREYLSGDVLELIRDFFSQPLGRFHAALYELDDDELLQLLLTNADRVDLILSDAGGSSPVFDTRNAPARTALQARMDAAGSTFTLQNRMFNGSGHIGHNKFVVHVDDNGVADSVLTGSTNWTWSGVAGQSNNCIRCDDPSVAGAFLAYWNRLHTDVIPVPAPKMSSKNAVKQSEALKTADHSPSLATAADGSTVAEMWFSPNVPDRVQPSDTSPPPVDMDRLFALMRRAKHAIFFLVFLPSKGGKNSIVSEAVNLGEKDTSLSVIGAISDSQAMWREPGDVTGGVPHLFQRGNVSVVRATALSDKAIVRQIGDFQLGEQLAAEHAIIHDKILVLDPVDDGCVVAFGSHNLGYKASYANDENLTIVQGNRPLAEAYATHVLDVYDHYRFRAFQADSHDATPWDGLLHRTDTWQNKSSRRLARYLGTRS